MEGSCLGIHQSTVSVGTLWTAVTTGQLLRKRLPPKLAEQMEMHSVRYARQEYLGVCGRWSERRLLDDQTQLNT